MDDTFVNVWLDHDEPSESTPKNFYDSWIGKASAKHADPALIGAHCLRKLYPKYSLVSTGAYDLDVLSYPGAAVTPLPPTPLITEVVFMPFARSLRGVPGVLVDRVRLGAFQVVWKDHEFLLFAASHPVQTMIITETYILHDGPEEIIRQFLTSVGAWSHELHNEVWVFNQGFWNKDRALWEEVRKAGWNDVILKDEFKTALKKDVYGFFTAEEVYKKLAVPWKRGLILYGPPGNGKTITLKAIMKSCAENGFVPLYVKSFQSWKGEEGAMADVFSQARQLAPCVLVLEDLDSLINDRNRSYFLNQLDGLEGNNGLLIIGTTNHFDRLDPGLSSRPSRFDRKFLFNDPDREERTLYARYWQDKLADNPEIDFPDTLVHTFVELTNGFSFAYLKEAFVSALVTLAGISGDKPSFAKLLKQQIHDLRKQLDKDEATNGLDAARFDATAEAPLHPAESIPRGERDIRVLLDALSDHISQWDPHETMYPLLHHPEPQQLDTEAQRVRTLLDSLSESVNASASPRIYRPFVSHDARRNMKEHINAGTSDQAEVEANEHCQDLLDHIRSQPPQPDGKDNLTTNRIYRRRLPSPPGPSGRGWHPSMLPRSTPTSLVQSRPVHRRTNFDASDLA